MGWDTIQYHIMAALGFRDLSTANVMAVGGFFVQSIFY